MPRKYPFAVLRKYPFSSVSLIVGIFQEINFKGKSDAWGFQYIVLNQILKRLGCCGLNAEAMFSSATDLWETPQGLFDELDAEFHFDLDVCALPENAKCERYFTPEDDGLSQDWTGVCWCNPPYGRQIVRWVRKAFFSSVHGATVVMLLPARTDTAWFHDYILHRAEVRFLRGRVRFRMGGADVDRAPFPSMLVIFKSVKQT